LKVDKWLVASGWWRRRAAEDGPVKPQKAKGSQALAPPESVKPGGSWRLRLRLRLGARQPQSNQGVLEIMTKIRIRSSRQKLSRVRPGQTQSKPVKPENFPG